MPSWIHMAGLFAALGCFLSTGPAHAELLERDLAMPGDAAITFDTLSEREWLDLPLTTDLSYLDVTQGVDNTWYAEGWRYATSDEVCALFEAYGAVPTPCPLLGYQVNVAPIDVVLSLQSLFGVTDVRAPGQQRAGGFFDDGPQNSWIGWASITQSYWEPKDGFEVELDDIPLNEEGPLWGNFLVRQYAGTAYVIDDFRGNHETLEDEPSVALAPVLGGERDLHPGSDSASLAVEDGTLTVELPAASSSGADGSIFYDGIDESEIRTDDGLRGFDLTGGGRFDRLSLAIDGATGRFHVQIQVWAESDGSEIYESPVIDEVDPDAPIALDVPLTEFAFIDVEQTGMIAVTFESEEEVPVRIEASSLTLAPEPTATAPAIVSLTALGILSRLARRRSG